MQKKKSGCPEYLSNKFSQIAKLMPKGFDKLIPIKKIQGCIPENCHINILRVCQKQCPR